MAPAMVNVTRRWSPTAHRMLIAALALAGAAAPLAGVPPGRPATVPTPNTEPSPTNAAIVAPGGSYQVRLLSQIRPQDFPSGSATANDVTGYVSPTGREYAIVGLRKGTGFVDVTDPQQPVIVADIRDADSFWSDMDVYDQYAYNVNESGGGLQIIDLTYIDLGLVALVGNTTAGGLTTHTIFVNQRSGFLYLCSSNINLGFTIFDLSAPFAPVPVGAWVGGIAHEVFPMSYDECPYAMRAGQPCELVYMFAANAGLRVIDVTDKANLRLIGLLRYQNYSYCHQGWLSADPRYLFLGDEADEQRYNLPATTYVIDVANPAAPTVATTFTTSLNSIDHNLMVRGRFLFEANYTTGLRVFDVQDPLNAVEVGHFDTFPDSDARTFEGAWGVYARFPSGTVLISDITGGLFVLDAKEATGCQADAECNDRNPCTADACTVEGACANTPLPVGAPCEDGDACTTGGTCDVAGACVSAEVVGRLCETDDNCFPGVCGAATGQCACESCVRALPPAAASTVVAKNRYLSVRPRSPGILTALRVTLAEPPPQFAGCKGTQFWVGRPVAVSEQSGVRGDSPPSFFAARLSSEPFFADWGVMGTVHIYGRGITPGGRYRIETVSASCWSIGAANFSFPLSMVTARWGDVVGACAPSGCTAPDRSVAVATDAMAVVDKYMNRPQAVSKTWVDVDPETPDQIVSIVDLMRVLDAYQGQSYPFRGPPGCE